MKECIMARKRVVGDGKLWLYYEGEEFNSITGGWDANVYTNSSLTANGISRLSKLSGQISGGISTFWQASYRGTTNKINLTNFNFLKAEVKISNRGTNALVDFYVQSVNEANRFPTHNGVTPAAITTISSNYEGIISIDVSSLSGEFHIFLNALNGSASGGGVDLIIYKVWGEI